MSTSCSGIFEQMLYIAQWLTLHLLGPSRCFPFWQEVLACYVVNTNSEDDTGKKKCSPVLEDYYECLHHKKEVSLGRGGVPKHFKC
jgi:hypothetical protein